MVSLRMNARVLSVLFESISAVEGERGGGVCFGGARFFFILFFFARESAPSLPGGGTTAPSLFEHVGGRFVLVQLLNVQCIM